MAKKKQKPEAPAPVIEPETFGQKLRKHRKGLRLTQDQAAAQLRLPVSTYRNWEQDRVTPSAASLHLIEMILGKID